MLSAEKAGEGTSSESALVVVQQQSRCSQPLSVFSELKASPGAFGGWEFQRAGGGCTNHFIAASLVSSL